MDMLSIRDKARQALGGVCRVCPQCNGKACAGEVPGMGGCGTGSSFMQNVTALAEWQFHMRTLHNVYTPDTSLSLWGQTFASPAMVAPMTGTARNLNNAMSEEDMAQALAIGAKKANVLAWTGDGPGAELFDSGLASLHAQNMRGIVTIKPRPDNDLISLIRRAEEINPLAIAVDVDAAGFGAGGPNPMGVEPKTPEALSAIIKSTDLPIILKGIMTPDEAILAAELGAGAIVVSNHGGRVLDGTPGTASVLPAIAENVRGRLIIFADGGVRSGNDVLKMLALGANAVLIGRPLLVAGVGGGADAVAFYFETIRQELAKAMLMTGVPSIDKAGPSILHRA